MKTMKTMKTILSIAALALTGALMSSCGTDDDIIENAPQTAGEQTAKKDNIVVVTTTVTRGDNQTKVLDIDYENKKLTKTFAVGERVAIQYTREGDGNKYKAVSNPLTEGDITNDGKTAKLTFTLVNPKPDGTVYFVYPAAMADEKGAWDPSKLDTQDGTLSSLAANLDLGTGVAEMVNLQLPDVTLDNQFAILAITLKNNDGTQDITSTITSMTVKEVRYDLSYTVNRSATAGPIYVAIQMINESDIEVTATGNNGKSYKKYLHKSYSGNNFYQQGLRMGELVDISKLTGHYVAQNGDVLTGTLKGNYSIDIAVGATVTLDNVDINGDGTRAGGYSGIYAIRNNTLILKGANTVKGFGSDCPGIFVTAGETLTIEGDGSLTATGDGEGAGIGAKKEGDCGNIIINGGTITANGGTGGGAGIGAGTYASCGNITINGGTITATGGPGAAGIGSAKSRNGDSGPSACGNITIANTVTRVTATKGTDAPCSIGKGADDTEMASTCGTVTIGGTVYAGGITTSPYTYPQP